MGGRRKYQAVNSTDNEGGRAPFFMKNVTRSFDHTEDVLGQLSKTRWGRDKPYIGVISNKLVTD